MPIILQAIDILRGRVLRLMQKRSRSIVAQEVGIALGTFTQFFYGEKANLTTESLQKIETWCDTQEKPPVR